MKKTMFICTLAALLLLALSGLALAAVAGEYPHLNSNDTGFFDVDFYGNYNSLVRAVPGQNVHTNFQRNTNSCASCHMTHTAVGRKLLFQATVSDTCFACHDGTIGVLNVMAAPTAGYRYGGSVTAGTFGLVDGEFNASVHNVNEVTVSGAPGGNMALVADSAGLVSTNWNKPFSCASCHAPHGSYSIRLLHSNPNFLGWRDANPAEATNFATGGLWYSGNTVAIGAADSAGAGYRTVTVTAAPGNVITAPWLYGYTSGTTLATTVTRGVYEFAPGRYNNHNTRIYATSLYDPNDPLDPINAANVNYNGGGPFDEAVYGVFLLNSFFTINYRTGTITIAESEHANLVSAGIDLGTLRMDIARALVVTADAAADRVVQALDYIDAATYGQANYNRFCAACHTDYLPQGTGASGNASARADAEPGGYGTYSKAHRHTINRPATQYGTMPVTGRNAGVGNQLLCVSCHFAHGSDERMMRLADATYNDFAAPSQDINPSSALKRYVNQAVCLSCHVNSAAGVFKNTDYYWDGYVDSGGYKW